MRFSISLDRVGPPKKVGREGGREGGRKGGREGRREGGREGGREEEGPVLLRTLLLLLTSYFARSTPWPQP
jgi:hypothetical protein